MIERGLWTPGRGIPVGATGNAGGGGNAFAALALADGATALYLCQELSGNLVDSVAGNDGVPSGTAINYAQAGPGSLWLPNSVQWNNASVVTMANVAALNLGNGPFSIEAFFWRSPATVTGRWLRKTTGTAAGYNLSITDFTPDLHRIEIGNTNTHVFNTNDVIGGDAVWYHVVYTRALATDAIMYVDAVAPPLNVVSRTFSDIATPLVVGTTFVFRAAAIAFYKTVLSPAQVTAHNALGRA